mmetsp:Transcript_4865/g.6298  ORF Transcript_4865/g.6298 Transcript_4865/m.6298 type:complete len:1158 (+) Transcript_4865:55-3528(+)
MTLVTQIEDRGATVAWSPIVSHPDVIALGAKDSGNVGFDNYGGELELFDLGITSSTTNKPQVIGSVKTTSRFSSIGWTTFGSTNTTSTNTPLGLIAGGMDNGTITIYNPSSIIQTYSTETTTSSPSILSTIERSKSGAITSLSFNPHVSSEHLLATGSSKGEMLITSLESPTSPTVSSPSGGGGNDVGGNGDGTTEITDLAWNTEVSHIIASSSSNGIVTIWDLRQNKPWCELRAETSGSKISSIKWNPSQGMHIMTSSLDDRNPTLKLWDLRSSLDMPLATTESVENGHVRGIVCMDWCTHDDSLLVSCGKDNKTLLWDLVTFRPICEIPNDNAVTQQNGAGAGSAMDSFNHNNTELVTSPTGSASGLYGGNPAVGGGGLSASQQRRYDVKWSPLKRGLLSTCSFDRKVQVHSVLGVATKCGRPPKWMKPASGVSCSLGGQIVSFGSNASATPELAAAETSAPLAQAKIVSISTHVENPQLKALVETFESDTANGNYVEYAARKQEDATNIGNTYDAQLWGFMQVIFEQNSRAQLLYFLGFDPEDIHKVACEYNEDENSTTSGLDIAKLSLEEKKSVSLPMSANAEKAVSEALLVGNFDAAVECCIRSGNLADALILASCGGGELWAKTQAHYFASEVKKRPFLSVVSSVIHNQLGDFVASSDPNKWHETLAAICTYGTQAEFPPLCEALGDRLESAGDLSSASLCYMCAYNLEKSSKFWQIQLKNKNMNSTEEYYVALHNFVEKVAIYMLAGEQSKEIPEAVADILFEYAKLVADQGLFESAAKYCQSNKQECKELKDRLYRSKYSQACVQAMGVTPEFPFQFTNVGVAPAPAPSANVLTSGNSQNKVSSVHSAQAHSRNGYSSTQGQNKLSNGNGYSSTQGYASNSQKSQATQPIQEQKKNNFNQSQHTQNEPNQLAPGWVAYQDPASGRTYYANVNTGETTWETPVSQVQPAVAPTPSTDPYSSQGQQQVPRAGASSTPAKLASKYGDGFVSSASHPELAAQYGNVGTSNPYTDSSRPGTAVVSKIQKPPVSGTFNLKNLSQMANSTEYKHMIDDLLAIVTSLSSLPLMGSETKQMAEVEKGTAIFSKRLGRNDIDNNVAQKVDQIVTAIKNKDFAAASGIHTSLVNSVWKDNKDWLKGMKFLIQMCAKRLMM